MILSVSQITVPPELQETLASVQEILCKQAADVLLPDTYQCGGLWACKLIGNWAAAAGVTCVFHCAHDFGLKTAAMLHVVASSPNFPLANDCTYYGLEDDIITEPFVIEGGCIAVPHGPGLGVSVDERKLKKLLFASSVTELLTSGLKLSVMPPSRQLSPEHKPVNEPVVE